MILLLDLKSQSPITQGQTTVLEARTPYIHTRNSADAATQSPQCLLKQRHNLSKVVMGQLEVDQVQQRSRLQHIFISQAALPELGWECGTELTAVGLSFSNTANQALASATSPSVQDASNNANSD
jgi:hypothetical protein